MDKAQRYFAGIDWASEKHDVWLTNADGKRLGMRTFTHDGEGLAQMCAWLIATSGAEPSQIHVSLSLWERDRVISEGRFPRYMPRPEPKFALMCCGLRDTLPTAVSRLKRFKPGAAPPAIRK